MKEVGYSLSDEDYTELSDYVWASQKWGRGRCSIANFIRFAVVSAMERYPLSDTKRRALAQRHAEMDGGTLAVLPRASGANFKGQP